MAKLDLNFAPAASPGNERAGISVGISVGLMGRRRGSRLSWLVLLIGLGFAVYTIERWTTAGIRFAALQSEYAALERATARGQAAQAKTEPALSPALIASANASIAQLNIPWPAIFQAVDRAATNQVGLLAFEPDVAQRLLRLSGETKTVAAMLGFVKRLSAQPAIGAARLLHHEINSQDGNQPIRFQIELQWAEPAR